MTPLLRKILGVNLVMVTVMFGLLIFGIYSIESAARHLPQGGEYFANRQKLFVVIGAAIYFIVALLNYQWVKWLAIPMYLGGVGLQLMLMAGIWEAPAPAVHQLQIPGIPISFQPTNFVLAAGIILLAAAFEQLPKVHRFFAEPMFKLLLTGLICGVPFVLVVVNGDMGSAIVFLPVAFVILLVGGLPFRYLFALITLGIGMLPLVYYFVLPMASDRAVGRIDQYLEILREGKVEKSDENWAPFYVAMAIGQAGWDGLGYNAKEERGSIHAKRYVPWKTAHNDYIFAVIGEEQGFRGALLMLSSFALLLIQMLFISFYSRDFMGQVMTAGIVAMFFAHIWENVGMCVQLMPITGIPLPLISYSGTFVVVCMFLLGLVQSVWVHRREPVMEEG